jgi:hypothetical protein
MNVVKKGGRIKGTPNKLTLELRKNLQLFLENNFERMQTDLDKLTPSSRLRILVEFYKLILPKVSEIDEEANTNFTPFTIVLSQSNENNNK